MRHDWKNSAMETVNYEPQPPNTPPFPWHSWVYSQEGLLQRLCEEFTWFLCSSGSPSPVQAAVLWYIHLPLTHGPSSSRPVMSSSAIFSRSKQNGRPLQEKGKKSVSRTESCYKKTMQLHPQNLRVLIHNVIKSTGWSMQDTDLHQSFSYWKLLLRNL